MRALAVVASADAASLDFPATPYTTVTSQDGDYRFDVRTAPTQPPARGNISLRLDVTSAGGDAVDGLALEVEPWMPAMGHSASITPTVNPTGDGEYLVTNLVLVMPGTWQLRVSSGGSVTVIPITVQ